MKLTFAPRNIIQLDDCRILFRNFAGAAGKYNREGDRSFAVLINDEAVSEALIQEGWNVKIKPPREDGDMPFMYLQVKIKYNDGRGPRAYLKSGDKVVTLDEDSIRCLDNVDIASVDLDIRGFDWEMNGKTGRSAYLQSIHVTQQVDRFAMRYAEEETPF
jgi:hypothetical protein